MQHNPAHVEFHCNIKRHIQSAMNDIANQVVNVGKLHSKKRTMNRKLTFELIADMLMQCKTRFPISFRPNTDQAVAAKFNSSAQLGNLGQKWKLFWFATHTDHQVHRGVSLPTF